MAARRNTERAETPINPPDLPPELLIELAGSRPPDEEAAFIDVSNADTLSQATRSDVDAGDQEEGPSALEGKELLERLDLLDSSELRAEETDDPAEAIAEGFTYIPPLDPPIFSAERDDADTLVARGFGLSAGDELYDADQQEAAPLADDEVAARVHEALRADGATNAYAEHVLVVARQGVVTLHGVVDDLEDADSLIAVAAAVPEVREVNDKLRVRSIEGVGVDRRKRSPAHTTPVAVSPGPQVSPFAPSELARFDLRLHAMRAALQEQLADLEEQLRMGDEEAEVDNALADHASDLYIREQALGLIEALHADLHQVDRARARISAGSYGVSELSGRPIPLARLEALPSATTLVDEPMPER